MQINYANYAILFFLHPQRVAWMLFDPILYGLTQGCYPQLSETAKNKLVSIAECNKTLKHFWTCMSLIYF